MRKSEKTPIFSHFGHFGANKAQKAAKCDFLTNF